MNDNLLNLNFNHWGIFLLSIIPALINVGIFIYAVFFLPQNKINKSFSLFVLLLGIAQTIDGLMRMSISAETAMVWCRMSTAPFLFAISFGLLFTLRFTGWNKKIGESKFFVLLFLPPILFEFLMIARLDKYTIVKSERWNWIANPESTPVTNSIVLWMGGIGLITLTLLWLYYFKERNAEQKKMQALLIAVGFSIPFVGGVATELIFPLIFHLNGVPLATLLITTFSIASLVAIIKYNMLDYSPKHQWNIIVETLIEGMVIVNNDCQIVYANKLFCQQVELEFNEIKGKIVHNFLIDELEQKKLIETVIEECENNIFSQNEIQLRTKSGKKLWMLIVRSPYLDTNGDIVGSILILTDITERKKMEDLVKTTNQELETFIYKTSHDLRSPLASIIGLVNVSKLDINDEKPLLYLNMIDASAKRLDNILIGLVHTMNLKDTKKMDEEINFNQMISESLKMFEHYEGYSRMIISNSVAVVSPFYSSKLIMDFIFQNMIENAIKYQNYNNKESFLKITITEKNKIIQAIFEDNGIGIDSSFHNKIFEMYFKAHNESKGSGLGLYLVNTGIKRLNGNIQIESEKAKGTKFIISMPLNIG